MANIRKLIIVEDDASIRRSLTRWAKVNGYEVFGFASASAFFACDIYAKDMCLILDLGLPDISGGEVKRRLLLSGKDLPTVFITGLADEQIAAELADIESPYVLRKPFDDTLLAAAIEAVA